MRTLPALLLAASLLVAGETPRLVVVISVDQMRPDTLTRFAKEYTGGLKRLLEGGRHFRGVLDHAATQTGPGHSTMLSGCVPARTGIVANTWLDRVSLGRVYCCIDPFAPVFGALSRGGRSPRLMLRDTLGDWMKAGAKGTKVYSISGKDRAAITMGGRAPDGAYWFEPRAEGFTTSAYYHLTGLPGWLEEFNGDGWLEKLPREWTYEPVDWLRADDDPRESGGYSRKSPHPLGTENRSKLFARLYNSPFLDTFTLRLARLMVKRFDLGGDAVPDLLCISLSATDTVGHSYGPFSQEIRDCVLRLDRNLGAFFDLLDRRKAPYTVALTADHGVLPIPEIERVDQRKAFQPLIVAVQKRFGVGDWLRPGGQIYLNRKALKEKGIDPAEMAATLVEAARAHESVAAAFDEKTLLSGEKGSDLLELVRKSWHPKRSGEVVVIQKKNVIVGRYRTGTTHGSPWRYDREVPLLFFGAGVAPGAVDREARTVDIAPTLAKLLGVAAPADLDGVPLPLR